MIKLTNLTRVFRTEQVETTALDRINLSVEQGEFLAIMGPSGCGKSTLLSILGLLDLPTSGQYVFVGEEISAHSERQLAELRKRSVGMIYQSFNLIDDLTVYENVELPLRYQRRPASECRERTTQILQKLGLEHRSKHMPQQLSGGQQQRVAVARALVIAPKLILADEPTGNLDSVNGTEVMSLLRELNGTGTTIVMVTHSEHDASYARRIVRLFDGRIESDLAEARERKVMHA